MQQLSAKLAPHIQQLAGYASGRISCNLLRALTFIFFYHSFSHFLILRRNRHLLPLYFLFIRVLPDSLPIAKAARASPDSVCVFLGCFG